MDRFTIRDAAAAFASLDETPQADLPALDKALRNLSQRVYLPPAGLDRNAGTYALHTICALRLFQIATNFGLGRLRVEAFAQWLQVQPVGPARRIEVPGGYRPLSRIEESLERVREGEVFDLHIIMGPGGQFDFAADWQSDSAIPADLWPAQAELARFTLPASDLIAAVVRQLAV